MLSICERRTGNSLRSVIYKSFITSSLIPLFTIELVLLVLYFGINAFIEQKHTHSLAAVAQKQLLHMTERESLAISRQIRLVTGAARLLQEHQQRYFENPEPWESACGPVQFATAPNGVFYKTSPGGSSLFYSRKTPIGPEQLKKAKGTESFDWLFAFLLKQNPNIVAAYFNSFDSMNRYYPPIPGGYQQYPPEIDLPTYNFYYLADAQHNPSRAPVWTGAYLDPAGKGWMTSCIVPIYRGQVLEGVSGLDITIDRLASQLLGLQFPWDTSAFLVDAEGTLLAMPPRVQKLFDLQELNAHLDPNALQKGTPKPESFNLKRHKNPAVAKVFTEALEQKLPLFALPHNGQHYLVGQASVQETGWRLFVLVDQDAVYQPVQALRARVRQIGYGAIGVTVVFYLVFFLYLQRKAQRIADRLAQPLSQLARFTSQLRVHKQSVALSPAGIEELDQLATNFVFMSQELEDFTEKLQSTNRQLQGELLEHQRIDQELQAHRNRLDELVQQRTAELHQTNAQLKREVQERQRAEQARNEAEREKAEALNSMAELVTYHDLSTRIIWANRAAAEALGKAPEQLVGMPCNKAWQSEEKSCAQCPVPLALRTGKTQEGEVCSSQGSIRLIRGYPIKALNGQVTGVVAVAQDITQRKKDEAERLRLESQLRQAQKLETIGRLAGGIAHDFNNILAPILGYTDMALDELPAQSRARSDLQHVLKAAHRARALVQQILTFSRHGENQRVPLQIEPLVAETLHLLRASLPSNITIHPELDPSCGEILGDAIQIHQVLMNLCTNAFHAMRERGGQLTVRLQSLQLDSALSSGSTTLCPGRYVRLSIRDTGCGMSPSTLERIFEPFFTTKQVGEGTGLGLSLVHGIVQAHEGLIGVESELGKGSCFELYFPQIQASLSPPKPRAEPVAPGHERILLVDDEVDITTMAGHMLGRLGYQVTAMTNSLEALKVFESQPAQFDLVVTDQTMPHLTGIELAQALRSVRPGVPIIVMTGYSEVLTPELCKAVGISTLLLKPLVSHELHKAIRRLLDQQRRGEN